MTRKPSPAVFSSFELKELLKNQGNDDKIVKWIGDMKTVLTENMYAGDLVPKNLIPQKYTTTYGVNNLYRYSHPEGYRSCYTILNREGIGVCPHILDIMDHDEYDRVFGYRRTR